MNSEEWLRTRIYQQVLTAWSLLNTALSDMKDETREAELQPAYEITRQWLQKEREYFERTITDA